VQFIGQEWGGSGLDNLKKCLEGTGGSAWGGEGGGWGVWGGGGGVQSNFWYNGRCACRMNELLRDDTVVSLYFAKGLP